MSAIVSDETRRAESQLRLDSERTLEERNALGQHATPAGLATAIADLALAFLDSKKKVKFFEPSIGTGAFYSALRASLRGRTLARAKGIELDGRVAIEAAALWKETPLRVECADFLASRPVDDERFNLVLANPPYVRHHHLSRAEKRRLQGEALQNFGIEVSGLAGLYVHFILHADHYLEEGAVSAWLVPTEWMNVNYGRALKEYFLTRVRLLRVHAFDASDAQFKDALVSSSVIWFRKSKPDPTEQIDFTCGSIVEPHVSQSVRGNDLTSSEKWLRRCQGHQAASLQDKAEPVLGDFLRVRRGIASGNNPFFIRPVKDWRAIGVPEGFLVPVLPSSRHLQQSHIQADADGYPLLDTKIAILDCAISPAEVQQQYPELWNYLDSATGRETASTYLARSRKPWYSQERRPPAPIVCSYMGRGRNGDNPFKLFSNSSRAIVTNGYLMLYPEHLLNDMLQRDPEILGSVRAVIEDIIARWYKQHGRVYGGGLHKLEPKELAALPASLLVERFPELRPAQNSLIGAVAAVPGNCPVSS
jgi:adenine-specific DNA-methyltransferase